VNRLKDATSPYLLQHADNPVDWWEWEPAAFDEAADMISPSLRSELLLTGFLRRKAQDYAGVASDWRSIEGHLPPKIAYSLKSFAMRR